jgi:phosphate-selective porin OprO/OprP
VLLDRIDSLEARIQQLEERLEERDQREAGTADQHTAPAPATSPEVAAEAEPMPPTQRHQGVRWDDGLQFITPGGNARLELGGRIHHDWAWFDDGSEFDIVFDDSENGTEFRRLRLDFAGVLYEDFLFKIQLDFAGGDAELKDVWIAFDDLPAVGQLKLGRFKEPLSLEELTSSNDISFMERSSINALVPSRASGIQLSNSHWEDRLTWALGLFRETDEFGAGQDEGGYSLTARLTGLPWYPDQYDGKRLLHLGAAYSHRRPDEVRRVKQQPEANLASDYLDTGGFLVDDINLYAAELALKVGRFSLQSEYLHAVYASPFSENVAFNVYYVDAGVFLTPDHRTFDTESATFGGVHPARPFLARGENRGPGAWELRARYSTLDLNKWWLLGGEQKSLTLGLNWYLNANVRFMLNYVNARIDRAPLYEDTFETIQARMQFAF